jgi:putative endonuclease
MKGWSRKKKEALIRGDFEALPELAKRRKPFPGKPETVEESSDDSSS